MEGRVCRGDDGLNGFDSEQQTGRRHKHGMHFLRTVLYTTLSSTWTGYDPSAVLSFSNTAGSPSVDSRSQAYFLQC